MKEKYNNKILNVYKISFNIKCEILFLVSNLKNNKASIYKIPVSEYCDKEYNIFKYLINYAVYQIVSDKVFSNINLYSIIQMLEINIESKYL